jgi:hypothetical protein
MIRLIVCVTLSLFIASVADAQKSYKQKKRRSDFFGGAEDYRDLRNYGIQLSFGPNYTFTRLHNETIEVSPETGQRYNYVQDPAGRLGGFIEIGMVHYRMKKPGFLKRNIIHYLDWGIGFDYIGGREKTTINYLDPFGDVASTAESEGKFYNGYVYGRITVHRLLKLTEKLHLDYGLGLNANYAVIGQNEEYDGTAFIAETQTFQRPFMFQVHAQLGLNIKLRRGDYLVPGLWAPVLGAYEWNSGKPTIQWYSSNYWPVHFQLKWMHNFAKKSNGCNTGSEEDRKKNKEYMQNR